MQSLLSPNTASESFMFEPPPLLLVFLLGDCGVGGGVLLRGGVFKNESSDGGDRGGVNSSPFLMVLNFWRSDMQRVFL